MAKANIHIKNKRAEFEYFILERYTAGIQLVGTEIKSIRASKASLVDSYCTFINNELWAKNMHIAAYQFGSYSNHEARRDRKLLLNRRELNKLQRATQQTGNTIIPIELFIDENGRAKLIIALCKGKKSYDKRETLKEKEDRRQIDREWKARL
ncbi:MAG: SsrA-binding protein SmpB [Paludibacteraceae bacterium]|nr:SsrA-binding protein SmpB [Paludibacteraceae bacterium]